MDLLEIARALNERREDDALSLLERIDVATEVTEDGQTALHLAARFRCVAVVRWLLEHKAPIEARTAGGLTPLMFAAGSGDVSIVRLLLENGADRSAVSTRGANAEKIASVNSRVEAAKLLRDWNEEPTN
jgi:ankyrin repeat protein